MATDSCSGTLPPSSRVTMISSSSIARSKLSFLTSTWVSSAISLSRDAPLRRRGFEDNFAEVLWRGFTPPPIPGRVPHPPPSDPPNQGRPLAPHPLRRPGRHTPHPSP